MKRIRNTITKSEIASMPKVLFEGRVFVIYTEADTDKAVQYLSSQPIVGVDTETRPSFKRGTSHKVALLQISTPDTCFLFRLNRIGMPVSLPEFLMGDTLKIGLSLKDDFMMLRRRKDLPAEEGNWIELQDYVGRFGIEDRSLQKIYANLFGKKISYGGHYLTEPFARVTVGEDAVHAVFLEICLPFLAYRRIGKGGFIKKDKSWLASRKSLDVGIV